jgi:hypothetical protein
VNLGYTSPMHLTWRALAVVACAHVVGVAACGGKVRGDPGAAGSAGRDTTSSTGPGAGTTGPGAGTGGSTGVGVTCDSVCQRIVASGCSQQSQPECVKSCETFRGQFPKCGDLYDAYLVCLQTTPLLCGPGGNDPSAPQCEGIAQRLGQCVTPTPDPPPNPGDAGPAICPGMVPPGPMVCSGGGSGVTSGSTTGGTGGPSQPTCINECTDANGNTWASKCVGSSCSCTYNGVQYCMCALAGPSCLQAPGCCPGSF